MPGTVGLGVAGCGRFAQFVLEALSSVEGLELVALASRRAESRRAALDAWRAAASHVPARARPASTAPREYDTWEALLADDQVDVVLVALPPHLHRDAARAAIAAGKHVFVEKPGDLDPAQLTETGRLAREAGVVLAVNLVMRQNPLCRLLARLVEMGALGTVERFVFENHANGDLPPGHWFWDTALSGGIFLEHGVHFFDLAHWYCGPSREARAASLPHWAGDHLAPDRVAALITHAPGILASHYHAFTRPPHLDRARLHLTGSRGFADLAGWIPEALGLELILPTSSEPGPDGGPSVLGVDDVARLLEEAATDTFPRLERLEITPYPAGPRVQNRGRPMRADVRLLARLVLPDRQEAYRSCIRNGFQALIREARGNAAAASPTLAWAAAALATAAAARDAADTGDTVPAPDPGALLAVHISGSEDDVRCPSATSGWGRYGITAAEAASARSALSPTKTAPRPR